MSFNSTKTSLERFIQTYKYGSGSISETTEDVYLTDIDSDSDSVMGSEVEMAPSPIKTVNCNIWEASCCICISPIVSRKGHGGRPTMVPRTVPTMWSVSEERVDRIYETFH